MPRAGSNGEEYGLAANVTAVEKAVMATQAVEACCRLLRISKMIDVVEMGQPRSS